MLKLDALDFREGAKNLLRNPSANFFPGRWGNSFTNGFRKKDFVIFPYKYSGCEKVLMRTKDLKWSSFYTKKGPIFNILSMTQQKSDKNPPKKHLVVHALPGKWDSMTFL